MLMKVYSIDIKRISKTKKCWLTLLKYQAMDPFHKDFDPDTPFYPNNYIKFAHEF